MRPEENNLATATDQLPTQNNPHQTWEESANSPLRQCEDTIEKRVPLLKRSFWRTDILSLNWRRQIWIWLFVMVFSVGIYYGFNNLIMTSVVVQGKSMLPTLHEGDHCILDRWTYRRANPKRGDLVVLRDPGHKDFAVKRIVGLPGESVRLLEGKVFVNKQPLAEPYLSKDVKTLAPGGKDKLIILGRDQYYVLGDNRMISEDSRFYGPVRRQRIIGNIAMK